MEITKKYNEKELVLSVVGRIDTITSQDLEKEIHNNMIDMAIVLGDIVISVEKVKEQSKEYGHSFKRELIYLVTHSMFHLLGYDHMQDEDKKIMREKEDIVMNILNITR